MPIPIKGNLAAFVIFNRIRGPHSHVGSSPQASHAVNRPRLLDPESDRAARLLGWGHELPDGVEDDLIPHRMLRTILRFAERRVSCSRASRSVGLPKTKAPAKSVAGPCREEFVLTPKKRPGPSPRQREESAQPSARTVMGFALLRGTVFRIAGLP
jgi:hypothetical protein